MKVGFDIDDVLYPWYDMAHRAMLRAGVTNGVEPTTWSPFDEYGITREQWEEILGNATLDGSLFLHGKPMKGALQAVNVLHSAGHSIHLITSRGYLPAGAVAQAQTAIWLATHGFKYDSLHFTTEKSSVSVDTMVDDVERNLVGLAENGVVGFLLDRPWNSEPSSFKRIATLRSYTDYVLGREDV